MEHQAPALNPDYPVVKVCGMRTAENIRAVETAGPDWMGFILWPGSRRYVATPPVHLPAPPIRRVGVFVDPTADDVVSQANAFGLQLIQLHGHETPAFCLEVKAALTASGLPELPIVKAFSIATPKDLAILSAYEGVADYFLFDTQTPLVGGSGKQFDWSILDAYAGSIPFLLSGGIGPEDVDRLRRYRHPHCIGFDVNSRFESAPATKDADALAAFIAALRTAISPDS